MRMPCEVEGCGYATEKYEPAVAVELHYGHHVRDILTRPTAPSIWPTEPTEMVEVLSNREKKPEVLSNIREEKLKIGVDSIRYQDKACLVYQPEEEQLQDPELQEDRTEVVRVHQHH